MELACTGESFFAPVIADANKLLPAQRREALREYIWELVDKMIDQGEEGAVKIDHALVDGLYLRTMTVGPDTMLGGMVHRKAGLSILSKGEISVLTDQGCTRLKAPWIGIAAANIARLGLTHSDVVWTSVHATTNTDLAKIEEELYAADYED